ncbi:DUF748 domain-containing protein [Sediminibacterium sp.]|uniref:DUF748 domain-containing protein n=1 Tax=Sediminibacterium sp. TaxID=1917865 RepID=UPI0027247BB6|nr:DUF748 domain-containing protein [Sediminibacterium sp.]MDO8997762.1 DUF748 domain-containing protein [Sediminibacterium sp.]MDP1972202.1 DUF748 domain-containing protein [Sediminibacterium sp.]MDP2421586.1 DUF748 domain-containing protein [Sediminibacterium sp.]
MKKSIKIIVILSSILLGLVLAIVIFVSPISKFLIEKYSEAYTGRKIVMRELSINIFNGSITTKGLIVYEAKSNRPFFKADTFNLNIAVYKLWVGKYDITSVELFNPYLQVIQRGNKFNYDDLMNRFFADDSAKKVETKPIKYWARNIQVNNATILYTNTKPLTNIKFIKGVVQIPLISWDDPIYKIQTAFDLSTGGRSKVLLHFNTNTFDYKAKIDVDQLSIDFLYPYLKDYMKVKSLKGLINTNLWLSGNTNQPTAIALSGSIKANDFAIIDATNELLTAIDETNVLIDTINTAKNRYNFRSISMDHPFFRLSMYDKGFNYERIMTTPLAMSSDTSSTVYSNVFLMMSGYIQEIVREYDVNNYQINQFRVTRGQCIFTDFTHGEKFRYVLDSMTLSSDRLSSANPFLMFSVKSRLNTSGKMRGVLKVDPKHYQDIIIDASIKELLITDFNPYSKYYVATPFLNGTISYENQTTVLGGKLDSKNILDIRQIKTGKKVKNSTAMNLPVGLAVSLLKDVKGNIHLDIPVTGSLNDPKFKWGRVIWGVLKNLVIKAATAPFRLLANLFGGKEEDFKEMQFEYTQTEIMANQQTVLDRLAKIAIDKPEIKIELTQVTNILDETEAIAVYQMKQKYLGISNAISAQELKRRTDSISNNDSLFVKYLVSKLPNAQGLQSTEEKSVQLIGREKIIPEVYTLMDKRNAAVIQYLVNQKKVPATNIAISNTKELNQLQKSAPPKYVINIASIE